MSQDLKGKLIRLKAHYPDIMRFEQFDINKFLNVSSQLADVKEFAIIQYDQDLLNYVAMALILKNRKYESYVFMNAYELIDIFLGNKEEFKCISDIDCKTGIIYLHGRELENKRQSDLIEQFAEMQRVEKKRCYVLFKGSNIEGKYPGVVDLYKGYNYPIINISTRQKVAAYVDDEL